MKVPFIITLSIVIFVLVLGFTKYQYSMENDIQLSEYPADYVDKVDCPNGDQCYLIQDKEVLKIYKSIEKVCPKNYEVLQEGVVPYPKNITWMIVDCIGY
jgi:hypothetical protein